MSGREEGEEGGRGGGRGGGEKGGEGFWRGLMCVLCRVWGGQRWRGWGRGGGGEEGGVFVKVLQPELGGSIQMRGGGGGGKGGGKGGEGEWVECFSVVQVCPSEVCFLGGVLKLVVGGMKLSWVGKGGGVEGGVKVVFDGGVLEEVVWTGENDRVEKGELVWNVFYLKTMSDCVELLEARYLRVFVVHESEILGFFFFFFNLFIYLFYLFYFYYLMNFLSKKQKYSFYPSPPPKKKKKKSFRNWYNSSETS